MTEFQPDALPAHAPRDRSTAPWLSHAYWPIVTTLIVFTVISLIERALLPVAFLASADRTSPSPAVPLLITCSAAAFCTSPFRVIEFIAGRQPLAAAALRGWSQPPLFYRNARRAVPDAIRLPDASSDLRTTA